MDTLIFIAGALVTILLIVGVAAAHKERRQAMEKRGERMRKRNEYRTNEEFISY